VMFGFDYTLECYTPAPKRKFGYFVLPILRRGELVGRLDAKAHRANGLFEIKAIYLEEGIEANADIVSDIAEAIQSCAVWHGTPKIAIRKSKPPTFVRELRKQIQSTAKLSSASPS
jgi:uncharacterized protein YcaQ